MKKISIIVPVYNVEKYIKKCLDSLISQSIIEYIKIILINDGSKDNSEKIILEYLNKYPQHIEYYKKENGGLSSARNLGIDKCNTDYIGFVDSDDYIDKNMFEKLYKNITKENADISICNLKKCDLNGNLISYDKFNMKGVLTKEEATIAILNGNLSCYAWNKLYRTDIFKRNRIKYPVGRLYEDIPTIYKLVQYSNLISIIDEPLYYYVQHNESICHKPTLKSAYDIMRNLDDIDFEEIKYSDFNNIFIINNIVESKSLYYRAIYGDTNNNYLKKDIYYFNQHIKKYKNLIKPISFITNTSVSIKNKLKFIMEYSGLLKYIYFFAIKVGM